MKYDIPIVHHFKFYLPNLAPNASLFQDTFLSIYLTGKEDQPFFTSNLRIEFHLDAGFMETSGQPRYNVHQICRGAGGIFAQEVQ
jgi:hypothetical protein